ncbi:stage II sporulation protein P [Syntrophomonas erecta subsp. sporosyntropha]
MESLTKRYIWIFFALLTGVMIMAYLANSILVPQPAKPLPGGTSQKQPAYVTIRDDQGNIVLETGLPVTIDDEFINENNVHYIIIKVEGKKAVAREKVSDQSLGKDKAVLPAATIFYPNNVRLNTTAKKVALYHTHSDESYILTSGTAVKPGNGDIFKVGSAIKDTLEKNGITAVHSWNNHNPHDINAYSRSRRTAVQLIKDTPDAVFDIHRDSAPASSYLTTINGVETARVMVVVGRSNPNFGANLEFARRFKAEADYLYPGLMRGIFIGKGDYNQDLSPRSLLFEMGTDQLSLNTAQKAGHCLADVMISILGKE